MSYCVKINDYNNGLHVLAIAANFIDYNSKREPLKVINRTTTQCSYIKSNDQQCERLCFNDTCWQHTDGIPQKAPKT
jgi:hypothetical protein